jgi:hypothetical protein
MEYFLEAIRPTVERYLLCTTKLSEVQQVRNLGVCVEVCLK